MGTSPRCAEAIPKFALKLQRHLSDQRYAVTMTHGHWTFAVQQLPSRPKSHYYQCFSFTYTNVWAMKHQKCRSVLQVIAGWSCTWHGFVAVGATWIEQIYILEPARIAIPGWEISVNHCYPRILIENRWAVRTQETLGSKICRQSGYYSCTLI